MAQQQRNRLQERQDRGRAEAGRVRSRTGTEGGLREGGGKDQQERGSAQAGGRTERQDLEDHEEQRQEGSRALQRDQKQGGR